MNSPMLPVLRIHNMYDQGMDAVDIYEWFNCTFDLDDIMECVLAYTATGGDYDHDDDDVDESSYNESELDY
jgi:hypothetical protein